MICYICLFPLVSNFPNAYTNSTSKLQIHQSSSLLESANSPSPLVFKPLSNVDWCQMTKVRFEINVYIFVFDIVLRIKEFAIHLLMSLFIVFSPFFSGGPVVLRNLNLVTSVKFKKIINYSTTQIYANQKNVQEIACKCR